MKTFEVFIEISYEDSIICTAETEEEAREIALAKIMVPDGMFNIRVSDWVVLEENE